jgi:hypothetical protein
MINDFKKTNSTFYYDSYYNFLSTKFNIDFKKYILSLKEFWMIKDPVINNSVHVVIRDKNSKKYKFLPLK